MRKMNAKLTLLGTVCLSVCALLVSACAPKPKGPEIKSVCVEVPQETSPEEKYVLRKAEEYLKEYGFTMQDTMCDVSVRYDKFGNFQGEMIITGGFWISRAGYWSQEGIVTVKHNDLVIIQDQQINLRGYETKQDLLDDLAWAVVKPVTRNFRSPTWPAKKK